MNTFVKEAIENANKRGMQFHVISEQSNYLGGEHVGKECYHSSWISLSVARVVAYKEVNGVIYNCRGIKVV